MESRFMTKYKVVLVPFPFDDLSAAKVRPAICLTEPIGTHHHVVLAFITSQPSADILPSDILIDSGDSDFVKTGLRVTSTLRLHRMMTVTARFIVRELGELPTSLQEEVDNNLRSLFKL